MNPNRETRRLKHKLIIAPKTLKSPIVGLKLNNAHKLYTCICISGWLCLSSRLPVDAFEQHVKSMKGETATP